jgi:hypothetical protein
MNLAICRHYLVTSEGMFDTRVLKKVRVLGPKTDNMTGARENYIIKSVITCTFL